MTNERERSEELAPHPANAALEELAAGGHDAAAEAHLATCAVCTGYVARLRDAAIAAGTGSEGSEQEASANDEAAFLAAVMSRAAATEDTPENAGGDIELAASPRPLADEAKVIRPLFWMRVAWVTAPLAAAAILLVLFRPVPPSDAGGEGTTAPTAATTDLHFKGGPEVAIVIDHAGVQRRAIGEARVAPGDRVRVEVSLDQEGPIVAGLLDKDGTWTPLLPATLLEAGTHFSDRAARVDAKGFDGWVLAGRPDAIEEARRTRDFHAVAVIPLVPMR